MTQLIIKYTLISILQKTTTDASANLSSSSDVFYLLLFHICDNHQLLDLHLTIYCFFMVLFKIQDSHVCHVLTELPPSTV